MRVGIAGLGRLGTAVAERFVATGHPVSGWNRTPRVPTRGVACVDSLQELVANADVIISCLLDGNAVRHVYQGPSGILCTDLQRKLIIDTSTITPQLSRQIGAAVVVANGCFVDAPVLGTIGPCQRGELVALLGGAAPDLVRAEEALAPLIRASYRMGPIGSGAAAKLAVNLVMSSYWAALGDAFALAAQHRIDRTQLLDVIAAGPAALAQLPAKRAVLEGAPVAVEFSLSGCIKDLKTMSEAMEKPVSMPVLAGVLASYEAAREGGFASADVASVALHVPAYQTQDAARGV